jgi:hypothetical protein
MKAFACYAFVVFPSANSITVSKLEGRVLYKG